MESDKNGPEKEKPKGKNKKKAKSLDSDKNTTGEKLSKNTKSKSMDTNSATKSDNSSGKKTPRKLSVEKQNPGKQTPGKQTPGKRYVNANRSNSSNQQFEPYMPVAVIRARGLASSCIGPGSLLQATLRINPKSFEDAFICSPDGSSDIYLKGVRDRNRALNNDTVIVEVDTADKWNILHENIQDYLDRSGTEDDYRILHKNAVFNLKKENKPFSPSAFNSHNLSESSEVQILTPDKPDVSIDASVDDSTLGVDNPVINDPVFGSKLAKVKVSDTPWDVSDVNVDHLANDLLHQVQTQKQVKPKKQKMKLPITIVAPDELEPLEDIDDTTEECLSDASDDIVNAIEENIVKMSAMGLTPDENTLEHTLQSSKVEAGQISVEEDPIKIDTFNADLEPSVCDIKECCDDNDDVLIESTITTKSENDTIAANEASDKISGSEGSVKKEKNKIKNKKNSIGKKSANDSVNFQANSPGKPNKWGKPAKLPKVEFKLEDVMKHPMANHFLQRCGRVVNIVEFKHNRCAVGTLRLHADKNPRFALFSPSDSRIPRLNIPMENCPDKFFQKHKEFSNTLFLARVESWDYPGKATGSLVKNLGNTDDINARTDAILYDLNINFEEFSPEVLGDLPPNHEEWSIPEAEIKLRRDFRGDCVFTIDPRTARDLDDALSVSQSEDGNYTVGVHIADVGYFVREGTALDREASERTTSTYMAQRVIPMLPRPLCEHLCSLNPGVDRLSYSVEWTIDSEGKIISEWFGRTVIKSCVKLSYDHAQMMIDEPERTTWEDGSIPDIEEPFTQATISQKVNMLQKLALIIRSKRESHGYLKISQPKLAFELNEYGMPYSFKVYEHKHSNKLIEEFMLLANMAVARKIYSVFPDLAVLRRHPPPKAAVLKQTLETLNALNIEIDCSSAPQLHQCLERLEGENPEQAKLVRANLLKCMELAKYFCTGMIDPSEYSHFALNVPYYTHFTSPIRRYPDILVHRLLDYAVRGDLPDWDEGHTHELCSHSNDQRLAAKTASEQSALLFLGLFIAECGTIQQEGSVLKVLDHALDVLLVDLGLTRRVYTDRLDIQSFQTRRSKAVSSMEIVWKNGRKQTLTSFSSITVNLIQSDKPFEFLAIIPPPPDLRPGETEEEEVIIID